MAIVPFPHPLQEHIGIEGHTGMRAHEHMGNGHSGKRAPRHTSTRAQGNLGTRAQGQTNLGRQQQQQHGLAGPFVQLSWLREFVVMLHYLAAAVCGLVIRRRGSRTLGEPQRTPAIGGRPHEPVSTSSAALELPTNSLSTYLGLPLQLAGVCGVQVSG